MKTFKFIQILSLIIFINTNTFFAQKSIGDDFSITDIYGHNHKLYSDYLDAGKYVFLNFFYKECMPCQELAPKIDTVFRDFGCNSGDLIFLGIDISGTDSSIWEFTQEVGMSFPTASGTEGGGNKVFIDYNLFYTPYEVLINPSRKVVMDNMYIDWAKSLRDSLLQFNLNLQACSGNEFLFYSLISVNDSVVGQINPETKTVDVFMPAGTNTSNLKAFFINSSNSTVYINNNEQISGETLIDFTNNSVEYQITSEDGSPENWTVSIHLLSTINYLENKFSIYPNPTTDKFIIESNLISSDNLSKTDIYITDLHGKIIQRLSITKEITPVNISDLPIGIYFINIVTNQNKLTKKIIKY